jgi:hypothetical protein
MTVAQIAEETEHTPALANSCAWQKAYMLEKEVLRLENRIKDLESYQFYIEAEHPQVDEEALAYTHNWA